MVVVEVESNAVIVGADGRSLMDGYFIDRNGTYVLRSVHHVGDKEIISTGNGASVTQSYGDVVRDKKVKLHGKRKALARLEGNNVVRWL